MDTIKAINITNQQVIATSLYVADTFVQRARGLIGRKGLYKGEGLYLPKCKSIHTFFMLFSIDVIFLDNRERIVKMVHRLKPFTMAFGTRNTMSVIELPDRTITNTLCKMGDKILLQS